MPDFRPCGRAPGRSDGATDPPSRHLHGPVLPGHLHPAQQHPSHQGQLAGQRPEQPGRPGRGAEPATGQHPLLRRGGAGQLQSPRRKGVDKYQRVYNPYTATLFSQIVGYDSPNYGSVGVEAYYNNFLESHTRPVRSLRDLLVNRTTTDNVTLTISSHLQLRGGRTESNRSMPTAQLPRRRRWSSTSRPAPSRPCTASRATTRAASSLPTRPSRRTPIRLSSWARVPTSPVISQAYQNGVEPGSTFKVVTSTAVYDHDPSVANVNYPAGDMHQRAG